MNDVLQYILTGLEWFETASQVFYFVVQALAFVILYGMVAAGLLMMIPAVFLLATLILYGLTSLSFRLFQWTDNQFVGRMFGYYEKGKKIDGLLDT